MRTTFQSCVACAYQDSIELLAEEVAGETEEFLDDYLLGL